MFKSHRSKLLALGLLTSLLFSNIPSVLANSYAFSTETIWMGGYDYSTVDYSWEYNPEVSQSEHLVQHYQEVEGAEVLNEDLAVDEDGSAHAVLFINGVGLQYASNETGAWVFETLQADLNNRAGAEPYVGIQVDSKGTLHIVAEEFASTDEIRYYTNQSGTWHSWKISSILAPYGIADFTLDSINDIHVVYLDATGTLIYSYIQNFENRTGPRMGLSPSNTSLIPRNSDGTLGVKDVRMGASGKRPYFAYEGNVGVSFMEKSLTSSTWTTTTVSTTAYRQVLAVDARAGKITVWTGTGNHIIQDDLVGSVWTTTDHLVPDVNYSYANFEYHPLNDDIVIGSWCSQTECLLAQMQSGTTQTSTIDYVTNSSGKAIVQALTEIGMPYFLYLDESTPSYLKFAETTPYRETIDTGYDDVTNPDLAVDPFLNSHIAYYDEYSSGGNPSGDLVLASQSSGAWSTQTIDSTGDSGWNPSIAADGSGNLYISYYYASYGSYSKRHLKFASNCSGSWVTDTVDGLGTGAHAVGEYSALAVDSSNIVHILYYDDTDGSLRYAKSTSACSGAMSWTTETVDDQVSATVGKVVSMVMAEDGTLHFSYLDSTNSDLKYGYGSSGAWNTYTLDSHGSTGSSSSIALDENGKVHISYYNQTDSALQYITNDVPALTYSGLGVRMGWGRTTVDNSGNTGVGTSIDFSIMDEPFITYYDMSNSNLMVAFKDDLGWHTDVLDGEYDSTGLWPSLEADSLGKFHVSYATTDLTGELEYLEF